MKTFEQELNNEGVGDDDLEGWRTYFGAILDQTEPQWERRQIQRKLDFTLQSNKRWRS